MDQICINKSKNKTIVFIHGFYANPGYWLPYLESFKNYKIVLLNIDYATLLKSNDVIDSIQKLFTDKNFGNNVTALISHSLGTVISNFLDLDTMSKRFEICPVGFSKRSDTRGFITDLKTRVNEHEQVIETNLLLVDKLINECEGYLYKTAIRYIPNLDQYFIYNHILSEFTIFEGDHFEINEAIKDISRKINQFT
jgi:hypothetical protein